MEVCQRTEREREREKRINIYTFGEIQTKFHSNLLELLTVNSVGREDPLVLNYLIQQFHLDYREPWKYHFGMVSSLTPAQFLSVNGYSNLYFGWGSEDDDMSMRYDICWHCLCSDL